MRSLALIGPDGAGKSTIARQVVRCLEQPARYLYMGVNLDQSDLMLPTTRLALAIKRARGRRAQMTAEWSNAGDSGRRGLARIVRATLAGLRLLGWLAEEWYRALVARIYNRRGYLVVFDRHFLFDYYGDERNGPRQPFAARLHRALLRRFYPRPDLVICLDAPAAVLHARKGEGSIELLERRRHEYLALSSVAPDFAVVDATQPLPAVVDAITAMVGARIR